MIRRNPSEEGIPDGAVVGPIPADVPNMVGEAAFSDECRLLPQLSRAIVWSFEKHITSRNAIQAMKNTNEIANELVQALNENQAAYDAKTISYTTYRNTRDALYAKIDAQSANVQSLVWNHQL